MWTATVHSRMDSGMSLNKMRKQILPGEGLLSQTEIAGGTLVH